MISKKKVVLMIDVGRRDGGISIKVDGYCSPRRRRRRAVKAVGVKGWKVDR